jgi:hypothetical protein
MPHLSADPLISDPEGIEFLRHVLHGEAGSVRKKTESFLASVKQPCRVAGPFDRNEATHQGHAGSIAAGPGKVAETRGLASAMEVLA